jgi:hypothetical protein
MEEIYSIDLTLPEILFIRQSLDLVSISGKDAHFLSNLQYKVENEIKEIEKIQNTPKSSSNKK